MADSAFQIQYRQEFIAQFEQGQSWLRNVCTTEAVIKGNQAMFLVAGSGGATAVTRGLNGNIPPRVDSLTQVPATLVEWHDKPQRTEFNIFASQGDGRRIMQTSTVKVLNRKIDQDILGMLSGASGNLGAAQAMTLALATRALAHLDLQDVDTTEEDNMFFVGSPAMRAYLMQIAEFQKAEYVEIKPLIGPARRFRRWAGFNWIFHPHLPNVGTSNEQCFAVHYSQIKTLKLLQHADTSSLSSRITATNDATKWSRDGWKSSPPDSPPRPVSRPDRSARAAPSDHR